MENSKIEWTDHTANLWWGCTVVHAGCDNCYAAKLDSRYHEGKHWGPHAPRKIVANVWENLKKFQRDAAKEGVVRRVFVGSMMDIFEKPQTLIDNKGNQLLGITTDDLRQRFFTEVVPNSPNLYFLLLTKRPSNINKYIPDSWRENGSPANVMFGTSVVNQETANKLIPELLKVDNKYHLFNRFLSCEPLLGPIEFKKEWLEEISWIIAGGESGNSNDVRPMHPDWVRSIQKACENRTDMARPWPLPFFMKQWGENLPLSQQKYIKEDPENPIKWPQSKEYFKEGGLFSDRRFFKVGKDKSGAILDGKIYKEFNFAFHPPVK